MPETDLLYPYIVIRITLNIAPDCPFYIASVCGSVSTHSFQSVKYIPTPDDAIKSAISNLEDETYNMNDIGYLGHETDEIEAMFDECKHSLASIWRLMDPNVGTVQIECRGVLKNL